MKTAVPLMRALRDDMRDALIHVRVETHPIPLEEETDKLLFLEIEGNEQTGEFDYNREERYSLKGSIVSQDTGAGGEFADERQDAVVGIYRTLRDHVTTAEYPGIVELRMDKARLVQGFKDAERYVILRFEIAVWAELE